MATHRSELNSDEGARVRRIDFDDAELFIYAGGDWRGFRSAACAKEPETAQWLREVAKPGSTLFDIGACVGSYSLIAAALGATVHAFEPISLNFSHLQRNILLNRQENITAWPFAISAETAVVEFELSTPIAGAASHRLIESGDHSPTRPFDARQVSPSPRLSPLKGEGANSPLPPGVGELERGRVGRKPDRPSCITQRAIAFALDELVSRFGLPQPDHIKIDVDGNETLVLEGARNTLRSVRTVMIETDKDTEAAVTVILKTAGLDHEASWPRSAGQRNHLFRRQ